MNKIPVGVQVYSVRNEAQNDLKGTIQQLKDMGYDGVELAGLYGHTAEEVRQILDEVGIPAISAHVPYLELVEDMEGTVRKYKQIGVEYIAVPYLTEEYRPGTDRFPEVVENIRKIGQVCKENGIVLLYHNHDFEFAKMEDGSYALDYLYATVPADILQTELDTCWVNVGGEDPAAYVRKYAGRCPVVHLKDFVGTRSANMYELIGIESKEEAKSEEFGFRPVGYGVQDMPAIVTAALESGAKWVIVEQDQSKERPPMEAVRMSIDYIRAL